MDWLMTDAFHILVVFFRWGNQGQATTTTFYGAPALQTGFRILNELIPEGISVPSSPQ